MPSEKRGNPFEEELLAYDRRKRQKIAKERAELPSLFNPNRLLPPELEQTILEFVGEQRDSPLTAHDIADEAHRWGAKQYIALRNFLDERVKTTLETVLEYVKEEGYGATCDKYYQFCGRGELLKLMDKVPPESMVDVERLVHDYVIAAFEKLGFERCNFDVKLGEYVLKNGKRGDDDISVCIWVDTAYMEHPSFKERNAVVSNFFGVQAKGDYEE